MRPVTFAVFILFQNFGFLVVDFAEVGQNIAVDVGKSLQKFENSRLVLIC